MHDWRSNQSLVELGLLAHLPVCFVLIQLPVVWTATGGDVDNVKFAIIYQSGGKLVCYSKLSTSQFNLTQDNTLTVTPSANGIFELT